MVLPDTRGRAALKSEELEVVVLGVLGSGTHAWNPWLILRPCKALQRLGGWQCRPSPGRVAG